MSTFQKLKKFSIKVTSNVFFRGSIFFSISNILGGVINYFFNIFAARTLGPSGYGEVTTFFSYLIILSSPIGIFVTAIILKLGEKTDPYSYTYSLLMWLWERVKKRWYFGIIFLLIIPFIPTITNLSPVVGYSIIPTLIIIYALSLYDGLLQGLQLLTIYAGLTILSALIKLLGPIVSYYTNHSTFIVILFYSIAALVQLILCYFILRKNFKLNKVKLIKINKTPLDLLKNRTFILTALSTISITLLSNIDIIYVKKIFPPEDAGFYSSWTLFAKIIMYVLGPLISLSLIFFSSKKHEIHHQIFFIITFTLVLLAGFGSLFAYGLFGRQIIDLFFGWKYYPIVPYLEWASMYGAAYVMLIYMNNYFLAKRSKQAYILPASLPFYCAALFIWGKALGQVMVVNIIFCFAVLTIYLLFYFKSRVVTLWQ